MGISTFTEATNYLRSFVDFERRGFKRWSQDVVSLEPMRELAEAVGRPHERLRCVHVAGTKGKGSTAAMLEAALRHAGYTTGLYTSPHLIDFCERIRLNGEPVSREMLTQLVREVQPAVEEFVARRSHSPTFFEVYTALAMLAFEHAGVDISIFETGLGGRLDATNIITPQLCIITTIGFDHTAILGNTLAAIAGEKAGIMKPGIAAISAPQEPEAAEVVARMAAQVGAPLTVADNVLKFARVAPLAPPAEGQEFEQPMQEFKIGRRAEADAPGGLPIRTPLLGRHQGINAAVAYQAVRALREQGWKVSDEHFQQGMAAIRWPGRFDVREARPWLVLDCAHNKPSAQALSATLPRSLQYQRLVLVLGISSDKDAQAIAERLAPLADKVILTQARLARAMPADRLMERTDGIWRVQAQPITSSRAALDRARELAGPLDCICVTGSIFVVGEAAAYLQGLPEEY